MDDKLRQIDAAISDIIDGISKAYNEETYELNGIIYNSEANTEEKKKALERLEKLRAEQKKALIIQKKLATAQDTIIRSREELELLWHVRSLMRTVDPGLAKQVVSISEQLSQRQKKIKQSSLELIKKNARIKTQFTPKGRMTDLKTRIKNKTVHAPAIDLSTLVARQQLHGDYNAYYGELKEVEASEKTNNEMLADALAKIEKYRELQAIERELILADNRIDENRKGAKVRAISKEMGKTRTRVAILASAYTKYYENKNRLLRINAAVAKYSEKHSINGALSKKLEKVKESLMKEDRTLSLKINQLNKELAVDERIDRVVNLEQELIEYHLAMAEASLAEHGPIEEQIRKGITEVMLSNLKSSGQTGPQAEKAVARELDKLKADSSSKILNIDALRVASKYPEEGKKVM